MLLLDSTRKLQIVLSANVAANQPAWSASAVDIASGALGALDAFDGVTNNTTAVDIVTAPAAGTVRQLKNLNVYNADTANATVTIQLVSGANTRVLYRAVLAPGQTLAWTPDIAFANLPLATSTLYGVPAVRNLLINALGTINQRGYVSGTATGAANQYTVDRWKVVNSGQALSWTTAGIITTFTAPAGGVVQVIEAPSILGGSYVLSWTGTATATVNGSAVTNGVPFTLPANTNATLAFASGTFSSPQLEAGLVATAFDVRPVELELALCQRYYEKSYSQGVTPGSTSDGNAVYICYFSSSAAAASVYIIPANVKFAVVKRAAPTFTVYSPATGASARARDYANGVDITPAAFSAATASAQGIVSMSAPQTTMNTQFHWTADAEL